MLRREWVGLAVAVFVGCGETRAQTAQPSHTPPAASSISTGLREGEIVVVRTAGQPDRRLQVARIHGSNPNNSLVDVVDLGSGSAYTVPHRMLVPPKAAPVPAPPIHTSANDPLPPAHPLPVETKLETVPVVVVPVMNREPEPVVAPVITVAQYTLPKPVPEESSAKWTAREPVRAQDRELSLPARLESATLPARPSTPPLAMTPPTALPRDLPALNSVPTGNPILPSDSFAPVVANGSAP